MDALETRLGYCFTNKALLREALTHPSCAETKKKHPFNYQRLEFLGDSVLSLAVAELLFRQYPDENEGSLAKRHAALVRSETLASVARALDIGTHMRLNASEAQGGGRENDSNLEDVCEALLGAIYLDAGPETALAFVREHWQARARQFRAPPKDAKTALQEWAQARGWALPVYQAVETSGPAHAPEFTIEVALQDGSTATAYASSKRQAEQQAAQLLLAQCTND